jgi:hypothetical protein
MHDVNHVCSGVIAGFYKCYLLLESTIATMGFRLFSQDVPATFYKMVAILKAKGPESSFVNSDATKIIKSKVHDI